MRSLFLLVLLSAQSLQGQADLLSPGSRVRVMKASERYEPRRTGRVVSVAGDSAVLQLDTRPQTTSTFALTRLERWDGTRSRAREGMIKGALIGGAIGFLIATGISTEECRDAMLCLDRQQTRLQLTPAGALVGIAIGYARGSRKQTDRWVPLIRLEPRR